jgi:hypothetical protein
VRGTLEVINQMQASGIIGKYAIGEAVGATFYLEPSATLDVDVFVELPTSRGSPLLSRTPYLTARGCKVNGTHVVIGDWPVQFLAPSNALEHEALAQAIETRWRGGIQATFPHEGRFEPAAWGPPRWAPLVRCCKLRQRLIERPFSRRS